MFEAKRKENLVDIKHKSEKRLRVRYLLKNNCRKAYPAMTAVQRLPITDLPTPTFEIGTKTKQTNNCESLFSVSAVFLLRVGQTSPMLVYKTCKVILFYGYTKKNFSFR